MRRLPFRFALPFGVRFALPFGVRFALPFGIRSALPFGVLLALLLLGACDTGADPITPPPEEEEEEVVAGVNLTRLFAAPTPAEEATVEADWAQRDASLGERYAFTLVAEDEAEDGAGYRVYVGRDAGTDATLFYGLVRIPPHPPGDQRARPLVLVLPDGADATHNHLLTTGLPVFSAVRDDYAYALLAYRGTTLDIDGADYVSPAAPSAYDRDADDALAFLAHVRALGASALIDPARVGVIGLGRGGGVALLTASRTHPYDLVVDLAGPTDLFLDPFRDRVRTLLQGGSDTRFPAFEALADDVLAPLRDSTLSLDQARLALLRRSPRYFFAPPPYTVVAHGGLDIRVFPAQSRVLGGVHGTTEAVYLEQAEADHGSLPTDEEVIALVTTALTERLGGP